MHQAGGRRPQAVQQVPLVLPLAGAHAAADLVADRQVLDHFALQRPAFGQHAHGVLDQFHLVGAVPIEELAAGLGDAGQLVGGAADRIVVAVPGRLVHEDAVDLGQGVENLLQLAAQVLPPRGFRPAIHHHVVVPGGAGRPSARRRMQSLKWVLAKNSQDSVGWK